MSRSPSPTTTAPTPRPLSAGDAAHPADVHLLIGVLSTGPGGGSGAQRGGQQEGRDLRDEARQVHWPILREGGPLHESLLSLAAAAPAPKGGWLAIASGRRLVSRPDGILDGYLLSP